MFSIFLLFFVKTFFFSLQTLYAFKFLPSASFYSAAVHCSAMQFRKEERKKKGTCYLATSGGYNSPIHTSVREATAALVRITRATCFHNPMTKFSYYRKACCVCWKWFFHCFTLSLSLPLARRAPTLLSNTLDATYPMQYTLTKTHLEKKNKGRRRRRRRRRRMHSSRKGNSSGGGSNEWWIFR